MIQNVAAIPLIFNHLNWNLIKTDSKKDFSLDGWTSNDFMPPFLFW